MKEMEWFFSNLKTPADYAIVALLLILIAMVAAVIIGGILYAWQHLTVPWSAEYTQYGKVVEKDYVPSVRSSGSGIGVAGGKVAVVSTSSTSSEVWCVLVDFEGGKHEPINNEELFSEVKVGDRIRFTYRSRVILGDTHKEIVDWQVC